MDEPSTLPKKTRKFVLSTVCFPNGVVPPTRVPRRLITDLFRTTHKVKTQQVARRRGEGFELDGYLENEESHRVLKRCLSSWLVTLEKMKFVYYESIKRKLI